MADHPLLTNYMLGSDFTSNNLCMIKVDASISELAAQNNMDLQIPCLPGRTLELYKDFIQKLSYHHKLRPISYH